MMVWFLALQLAVGPVQHYQNAKQDFAQQKMTEAVSEVDSALHENPYMVPALVLKARMAVFANRPDIAKSCLITAVTVEPTSEEAQFFLGAFFYKEDNYKSAISPLEAAKVLSPKNPQPVFFLAMTYEDLGDTTKALELFQRAESLAPEKSVLSAEILVAHGKLLLALGRTDDGIKADRRAIKIDPGSRDAHYELAKGLDHKGDFKDAAVEGELALKLPQVTTSDAQVHFLLANLYRKLNEPDLAKAHMEKFLATRQPAGK